MGTKTQPRQTQSMNAQWEDTATIEKRGDPQYLKEQLSRGNIVIMCDGSTKNGYGAAAWRITTLTTINSAFIQGSARTQENFSNLTSHRAECTGILAGCIRYTNSTKGGGVLREMIQSCVIIYPL
jgi:hypothetical protein